MSIANDLRIVHGAVQAAIYDLSTGNVFAVNQSGVYIIEALQTGKTPDEIAELISSTEGIALDTACLYVNEFLMQLDQYSIHRRESNSICVEDRAPTNKSFREVWLELTHRCNLRCLHCYASAGEGGGSDMSTDVWLDVMSQLTELGCEHLQLTGGEPFSRLDFWQIAEAALGVGAETEIFSNLTLCSTDDLDRCKDRVSVATTILGPNPDVHERITQIRGSFAKTVSAIKHLVSIQVPVRVSMIVMAQNEAHVDSTLAFIESLGVSRYGTDNMRFIGRGAENRTYSSTPTGNKLPQVTTSPDRFFYNQAFNSCWGHKLTIRPDGTVAPCIFARDINMGNVLSERLDAMIAKKAVQDVWRLTLDHVAICQDCEFRYACHDCRPLAISESADLFARAPRCFYNPYTGFLRES